LDSKTNNTQLVFGCLTQVKSMQRLLARTTEPAQGAVSFRRHAGSVAQQGASRAKASTTARKAAAVLKLFSRIPPSASAASKKRKFDHSTAHGALTDDSFSHAVVSSERPRKKIPMGTKTKLLPGLLVDTNINQSKK
jgi:hypothetical protein